ncbi:MAG TPA: hypothetical protein VLH39_04060 [Magnetospirillaceae bacterium]|nr:hypothetical protein [Magnetospirillaceae bacterium]
MKSQIALLFLLLVFARGAAEARTVSVVVLEDARGPEAPELSDALLGGCMDRLFESGFIATNQAVGRIEKAEFESRGFGIRSAREGHVDYLALIWVRYMEDPSDPADRLPEFVAWRLIRVRDGAALVEGSSAPSLANSGSGKERRDQVSGLGRVLADTWTAAVLK